MSDENKANDAEKLQEERASSINKRSDEVVSARGLESYLKERWMMSYIKEVGCPFIYDMMMYKQVFVFLLSFVSLFFIGNWGFLLMFLGPILLIVWEVFDRFKGSRNLIREMAGHDNAANVLQLFASSFHTEGLPEWQLKLLKDHTKMMAEVRGRLEVLDRAEKSNKAIKNDKAHVAKKEELLMMRQKVNSKQPWMIMIFCLHMYKEMASSLLSIK